VKITIGARHKQHKMNSSFPTANQPGPERQQCELISQGVFSWMIQASLAFVSLASLYVKFRFNFHREHRDFTSWSLDASKQGIAAFGAHVVNLCIAILLSMVARVDDECSAYLVNFVFNIFASFPIVWGLLRLSKRVAVRFHWKALERRGFYGAPTWQYSYFWLQSLEWTLILCSAKILAAMPLFMYSKETIALGRMLLHPLVNSPKLELVVVMIIVPSLLNVMQGSFFSSCCYCFIYQTPAVVLLTWLFC